MQVWGPGYAQKLLNSVTRVFTIALPRKMPKPSSAAGGTGKRGKQGAIASDDKLRKLAERAKEGRAEKRKVHSDDDEDPLDDDADDDAEELSSDSDAEDREGRERRAEKLRKLERDRKAEEALDKSLAEQEAKNPKKLKALSASRNSFPSGDEVIVLLKIECDYLVDIGVSSSVLVILSFVSRRTTKVAKVKAKAKAEP